MPEAWHSTGKHVLISLSVVLITGLNLLSAGVIGKAENWVVGLKVAILLLFVTVGNLAVDKIVAAKDYALAEAARPFLGPAGFTLIAIAAMLSTASAINATLYGAARLSYCIACLTALGALIWQTARTGPRKLWVLAAMVAVAVTIEGIYRLTKREIKLHE